MKLPPSSYILYSISHLYRLELKLNVVMISAELFSKPTLFLLFLPVDKCVIKHGISWVDGYGF